MQRKKRVGIIGATGLVGKILYSRLQEHPYFEVVYVAASKRSVGMKMEDGLVIEETLDSTQMDPLELTKHINQLKEKQIDLIFIAATLNHTQAEAIYYTYLHAGIFLISCQSTWRMDPFVPIILPAINSHDLQMLTEQRVKKAIPSTSGIICKSNCTIQGMVAAVTPLLPFIEDSIQAVHLQSASGAGRIVQEWPELQSNLFPYIEGEEEKSQLEVEKVWKDKKRSFAIQATSIRVPVNYGHLSIITLQSKSEISPQQILDLWQAHDLNALKELPSTPEKYLNYYSDPMALQPHDFFQKQNPMAVAIGRLKISQGKIRFLTLTHNLILGAAGSAIWTAELCYQKAVI